MATGTVSSAAALGAAPSSPAGVLRSGESLASTAAALSDPNAKTYHHMVPGARFVMPNGLELRFLGGQLTTADKDIIKELDSIADRTTSQIYTKAVARDSNAALDKLAAEDASKNQGKVA